MKKESVSMIFSETQNSIENCLTNPTLRVNKTAFTRERKLGAARLLHIILHRIYEALQLKIDKYFGFLEESPVSKQALSKARSELNPEFVRSFADMTAKCLAEDDTMPCYQGMRLIAIDGSDIALENTPELKEAFGCSGPNKDAATALVSLAYGPLDHVIYDCRIDRYEKDERDLAQQHVERLKELGLGGSLLLFDRGYPSAAFIAYLQDQGFQFVMRVRRKWSVEADAIKRQGWIDVAYNEQIYKVRVLKIRLPNGETETLLTTLNQKQLPIRKAGKLYFKRWGIETTYDLLKSKLQLENFSGKTEHSVQQDFYATVYLGNVAAACAAIADEKIEEADRGKDLKYTRQANRNRVISKLREDFLEILTEPDPKLRNNKLEQLFTKIAQRPVSIVPNRSPQRKGPRKKRFYMTKKTVV
jgi:hypothetical protein